MHRGARIKLRTGSYFPAIIAVAVNTDGRREVLGLQIGTSEAEPIWTDFLRKLTRLGLRGVKLVVSDAHEGIKAAVTKVLCAPWRRCRVHFMRNMLAYAGKSGAAGRRRLHRYGVRGGDGRGCHQPMAGYRRSDSP